MDLPIVCTLSPETIKTRRAGLLPGLLDRAESHDPLPNGHRARFLATGDILTTIAQTIDAERQCCRFLTFTVTVEQDGGPITLDITGPTGTREFLDGLLRPAMTPLSLFGLFAVSAMLVCYACEDRNELRSSRSRCRAGWDRPTGFYNRGMAVRPR